MLTLSRIILAPKPKPYRIELSSFTHENGDFGATFVTEQSFAPPISKVERHISDITLWYNVSFVPLQSIIQDIFSCRHERLSSMVWTKPYLIKLWV